MPATQKQEHCRECGRPTLHTRQVEHRAHTAHLLMTLFSFGLWLPIWILLELFPEQHPWHCTQCGHTPGNPTTADKDKRTQYHRRQQIQAKQQLAADRIEEGNQRRAALQRRESRVLPAIKSATTTAARGVGSNVRRSLLAADRILEKMATGDNFTHWFFRILFGMVGVLIVVGVVVFGFRLVFAG